MGQETSQKNCSQCGTENSPGARFCNNCAAPFGGAEDAAADTAERKQVTVLFADLTGFTALTEQQDPEETRRIMATIFERAAEIVNRYDGRIEKFVGDAIMAIFGVPLAHEDDPHRAVRAALELHEAVSFFSTEIASRTDVTLNMHSGVNTGVVVTGELRIDHGTAGPLGDTINTAARLMNSAPSGEIWIGPETARLVAAEFDLKDEGLIEFKGKSQPIAVASVVGDRQVNTEPATTNAFKSAFVGRQAELGALLGAAEKMRDGQHQAFGVCGDAGSGKSRLVAELRMQLGNEVNWLEGRAYSYSEDIPYASLIDLMRRVWKIEGSDDPASVRAKIEAGIGILFGPDSQDLPLFLHLFDLPQADGVLIERESFPDKLNAAMSRVSAGLANLGPTVICFQDLHWSDPSSNDLIAKMVTDTSSAIMLMANYRPGFTPPPGMQEISLSELSPRQTGEMLASLLGSEAPDGLNKFVKDRCDGNPFYVEEVVNSLRETKLLIQEETGWALAGPLTESSVPATIRGVIAARIDRLDDARRRLLREAAVIGREFLVRIVEIVGSNIDDLATGLDQLQAADLIRQGRLEPSLAYMFKHALTQDVAYEGLLKTDRQALHVRTATALEQVFNDRVGEYVETLAYHFQRGGDVDKATHYLILAGTKCLNRYALTEAEKHFRDAYALRPKGELTQAQMHTQTRLLVNWAQLHYFLGTVEEWHGLLNKHLPEAERCGDQALHAAYLGWLGNALQFHGDMPAASAVLSRGDELARASGDKEVLSFVSAYRMYVLAEQMQLTAAIELGRTTEYTDDDRREGHFRFVKGQSGLTFALAMSGELKQSSEVASGLIEIGRNNGNARASALGGSFMAWVYLFGLDFERAAALGKSGFEGARDPLYQVMCVNNQVIALMADLQPEPVLALTNEWMPYLDRNGNNWFAGPGRCAAAAAQMASGELSDGMRRFQAAIEEMRAQGALCSAHFADALLALSYVAIARFDVKPTAMSLVSNPWFVLTQAPFAARKANALIASLREVASNQHLGGLSNVLDLAEGRLAIHQRKVELAEDILARLQRRLREQGFVNDPAPVVALAGEIEAKR